MTEAGLSRFALLHWRVSGDWVVGMVVGVVGRVHGRVAHHHCINRQSRLYGLGKDVRTLHSYLQSASLTQSIVYTQYCRAARTAAYRRHYRLETTSLSLSFDMI